MKIKNVCIATFVAWTFMGCSDDSDSIGNGTADSPYQIRNKEQLMALADSAAQGLTQGRYYIQMNDIDLSGSESDCWQSIGYYDLAHGNHRPFQGIYDGDNHNITGLYIHNESDSTAGLFGFALDAEIRNLTVSGNVYSSKQGLAGICGYLFDGIIENCENQAAVTSDSYSAGGICGYANGYSYISSRSIDAEEPAISYTNSHNENKVTTRMNYVCNAFIKNCRNKGDINALNCLGGICGYANTVKIERSENAGKITSDNYSIAGICGEISNTLISYCKNTGEVLTNIQDSKYVGGIVGESNDSDCIVTFCENEGNISGYFDIGGISGRGYGIKNCINRGTIIGYDCAGGISGFNYAYTFDCFNYGKIGVENAGISIGGICGESDYNYTMNCGNWGDVFGNNYVGGIYGGQYQNSDYLINVFNMGNITGNTYVGGIAGYIPSLKIAYNTGIVTSSNIAYGLNEKGSAKYSFWSENAAEKGSAGTLDNCSIFSSNQTLTTPIIVNETSYDNLLSALNAAVEANKTEFPDLKSWNIISTENNGYPIFE